MVGEQKIGVVVHYYSKISVAVVELSGRMALGDNIRIKMCIRDRSPRAILPESSTTATEILL